MERIVRGVFVCLALGVAFGANAQEQDAQATAPSALPRDEVVEQPSFSASFWWTVRFPNGKEVTHSIQTVKEDGSFVVEDGRAFSAAFNLISRPSGAGGIVTLTPDGQRYLYPLYPGKTWKKAVSWASSRGSSGMSWTIARVIGWENITMTLIGGQIQKDFHVLRIEREIQDKFFGKNDLISYKSTCWYSPEAGFEIKCVGDNSNYEVPAWAKRDQ